MAGFLMGAAGMFATMYSTQAILPILQRDFGVTPVQTGLTLSVVILAVAAGGWLWGPVSDRIGRKRSIVLASGLIVAPTLGVAVAPSFEALVAFRALQGLCMPGLIIVGVPYVAEVFVPRVGGGAMGYYIAALVVGGLVGRLGVGLASAAVGWRWALGGLAALPLGAALAMRGAPGDAAAPAGRRVGGLRRVLRSRSLLRASAGGAAIFFTFVGTFSFVTFRLVAAPFELSDAALSLIFVLWVLGALGPFAGRLADRVGWDRLLEVALAAALAGLALSLLPFLPTLVIALGLVTAAMFSGVTAAQLGVAASATGDRGLASATYFTAYYLAGALGGVLPGLAWQSVGWPGVAAAGAVALACALVAGRVLRRDVHRAAQE